jgi:hypothetical protein
MCSALTTAVLNEFAFTSVGEMGVEDEEVRPGTAIMGMSVLDVTSPSRLRPSQN